MTVSEAIALAVAIELGSVSADAVPVAGGGHKRTDCVAEFEVNDIDVVRRGVVSRGGSIDASTRPPTPRRRLRPHRRSPTIPVP